MKANRFFSWLALGLVLSLSSCKKEENPEPELELPSSEVILYDSDQNKEVRAELISDYQERNVNFIACWWVGNGSLQDGCTFGEDVSRCAIGVNIVLFKVKGIKGGHPVTIKVTSKSGLSNTINLVVQPGTCVLRDVFKP